MKQYLMLGLLAVATALLWTDSRRVVGQENVNPRDKETIKRSYDIGDLLIFCKDYPLSGDFVPLPQINQSTPAQNQQGSSVLNQQQEVQSKWNRIDEIKKYITDNVDPNSWKDNGGDVGSISSSPLLPRLLIVTTAENQKAIQKLLEELRSSTHIMRVRADWLLLPPGQIEKLQKNGADDPAITPEISRDQLRALPENTVHYTGSIVCFDGQTVHIAAGRARTIVTNVTPVVAPYAAAMDPAISKVHEGIALEVTPSLAGDFAILDLSSIITEPNRSVTPPSTQPTAPALEHIDSLLQQFHTTLRVPLNELVLVAGSTADPNPDLPAGKLLYLVVQVDAEK